MPPLPAAEARQQQMQWLLDRTNSIEEQDDDEPSPPQPAPPPRQRMQSRPRLGTRESKLNHSATKLATFVSAREESKRRNVERYATL